MSKAEKEGILKQSSFKAQYKTKGQLKPKVGKIENFKFCVNLIFSVWKLNNRRH